MSARPPVPTIPRPCDARKRGEPGPIFRGWLVASVVAALTCGTACEPDAPTLQTTDALYFECGSGIRYPTTEAAFQNLYAGRAFRASGNHIGRDILYVEGTEIHPIACGDLIVYKPADGYGNLVAVIEHRLSRPITVTNGNGVHVTIQTFLSIYGHLRATRQQLNSSSTSTERANATYTRLWSEVERIGTASDYTSYAEQIRVMTSDVIGYVENAALNGDGDEHLHFGIRLQSYAEARPTDACFYRGYDATLHMPRRSCDAVSQFANFADPALFMAELTEAMPVMWHPTGTFIVNRDNPTEGYLVTGDTDIVRIDPAYRVLERLDQYAIPVSPTEIGCYRQHAWSLPSHDGIALTTHVRFGSEPAVYELHDVGTYSYAFINHEAFLSWGLTDAEVQTRPLADRDATLRRYADHGLRRMRPGSLVRAVGSSEVSFVTDTARLPFFDWDTFVGLGFDRQPIFTLDPSVIDAVANPRGAIITADLATLCRVPSCTGMACADAGSVGGGGTTPDPDASTSPDAGPRCVVDRDCARFASGWRCVSEHCVEVDVDGDGFLESSGDCNVDAARFHPGAAESCDHQDENCNGVLDDGFDFATDPNNCGGCGSSCPSGTCVMGSCVAPCSSLPEICGDGVDNNCSGTVDEGCAPTCVPVSETCDGRDQNCNGAIDEGNPGGGASCDGSDLDLCLEGIITCSSGILVCSDVTGNSTELCNSADDDCDTRIDEGGVCPPSCAPTSPSRDVCDGRDNDCNGTIDDGCPAVTPYFVEIWMDPTMLDDCPDVGGFRINLWGPGGVALQNAVGQPFRRTIDATWVAASAISLSCSVAPLWHDWTGHAGQSSSTNGVLVLRMGGRDMLPTSLVCDDLVNPAWGAKPYLPLEARYESSCAPRW